MFKNAYFQEDDRIFYMNFMHTTIGTDLGYRSDFHSHKEFEIFYYHEGKCNYMIEDKIYALSPGDMIIMHGMTLHKPNPDPNVPYKRTTLHFNPVFISNLTKQFDQVDLLLPFQKLKNIRIHMKHRDEEIVYLLGKIYSCYKKSQDPLKNVQMQIYLLELLALIYEACRNLIVLQEKHTDSKLDNVQKVIDYIEGNYLRDDLTLEQIAKETYLSKFYISRIFKEVTGTNIKNYILSKKINLAKVLLMLENKSVTEVSYEVGFKHSAHFSRIFKQKVGITAEEFRRLYKNGC